MAFWIHSLLCLIPAPIDRDAVFAPANKYSNTMTKGEHDDEKLLNYTSVFWWDIFKTFFSFPDKVIPSSLPGVCLFHLILSFAVFFFWETFHHRSVQLLLPSCFYIPPPVIQREWRWGVCHHLLCSEGSGSGAYACCVFMWKCVRRGVGEESGLVEQNFGR